MDSTPPYATFRIPPFGSRYIARRRASAPTPSSATRMPASWPENAGRRLLGIPLKVIADSEGTTVSIPE